MTKKVHYPKVNQNIDFAKLEEDILKFWQEEKIFEKSIEIRDFSQGLEEDNTAPVIESCALKNHDNCRHNLNEERDEFVFYDGPPFANGLPHYGHLLTGFIKDIFARYQTMKGKKVERRFGWDTHGLPVEMETEKFLTAKENRQISGQIAIKEYGIEKFNQACEESVMKYANEWEHYVTRQGRFVDFKNSYKTKDVNYMESVIWAFKQLFDKGLIYEDFRVVPYSWACQTPLSNFETKMDNAYRQKASKAVTVKFELTDESAKKLGFESKKVSLIAWTTTPWTLPSNLALGVGKEIEYCVIKKDEEILLLADCLLEKLAKDLGEIEKIITTQGSNLIGLKYKPLFPYLTKKAGENSFTILHGDFVTTDAGTGIVHMAPGFGEDDQLLCKANGIPTLCPVDEAGKFGNEIYDIPLNHSTLEGESTNASESLGLSLKGKQVFETNDDIIKYLKATGSWVKTEQYLHDYPHCWRTDTPLIYKAVSSWYVKVTDIKDRMVELNKEVNWIPNHIQSGQFGKWLEGARDWSITRNRFWGCPVPVWRSKSGKIKVFGSIAEIEKATGQKIDNLHRPFIDNVVFEENGEEFRRVEDVLDCWFESGSMPYGQAHYPFENKEWFEKNFPADFITEYVAQTRGWFYTLFVLSTAIFDKAPFKNVICHGTILDEKAQKLSKRLQNYANPLDIFDKTGSDAMRFFMVSQPVMRGLELKIDKEAKAIFESLRLAVKPIINAFNFFCLYANADGIKAREVNLSDNFDNILDKYILAKLKNAITNIDKAMKNYDTPSACEEFVSFFENLNNWYIRRSRNRFWQKVESEIGSENNKLKQDAYNVLYTVLIKMSESSAPLLPFTCEHIWRSLKVETN